MTRSMKIFIAGATGVLGRRVVPLLVAAGHRVTAVARTREKAAALVAVGAEPVQVDLFDPRAVRAVVAGHDVVINIATQIPPTSRMLLPWAWSGNHRIRTEASANLAEAARATGASRYIQESLAPIYESGGDAWLTEESPVRTVSQTHSVLAAERAAARFSEGGGTGVVLRFSYFHSADSRQTQDLIRFARMRWAGTFGPVDGYMSSIHCDDAATAVVAALGVPGGTYNVSDDEPLRRRDYFEALAAALGTSPPILPPTWLTPLAGPLAEGLARSQRISNRRFREVSGWAPKVPSMREGWARVVEESRGAMAR